MNNKNDSYSRLNNNETFANALEESIFCKNNTVVRDYATTFAYDFSAIPKIEKTLFNMCTTIGLSIQMNGTIYLVKGLAYYIDEADSPRTFAEFCRGVARNCNIKAGGIKAAILRALNGVGVRQLQKINRMFCAEILSLGEEFCVKEFIVRLCTYLVMLKSHQDGNPFLKNM